MKITWRDSEYELTIKKLIATHDGTKKMNIDKNIYAMDTESVLLPDGRYEIQCFQISTPDNITALEYVPTRENGLEKFINYFADNFADSEFENVRCFMYCHNLVYDWLQLIKNYPDLVSIAKTGIGLTDNYEIYSTEKYKVYLLRNGLFEGNAPFFDIEVIFESGDSVILMFRDTFSFFPSALSKLAKELKLDTEKEKRKADIGLHDFRNENGTEEKAYFEKYAKQDAVVTRLVAEKIRELHIQAGMKKIRVSAPSFAIGFLFHELPEETTLKNGVDNTEIMQLILDTYAGGRTGGIYHGKVENISVLDFHSSYPASMTCLPSFTDSMEYLQIPNPELLSIEDFLELCDSVPVFARISGIETDCRYPALIHRKENRLTPIYGEFENEASTGTEILVGVRSGTLTITRVHDLVILIDDKPEILPFQNFAKNAYNRKANSEKGSAEYTSAKLVLNSSYGKLIEAHTKTMIDEDARGIILPYIKGEELKFAQTYYSEYIEMLKNEETDFIKYIGKFIENIYESFPEEDILTAPFEALTLTKLTYGRFAIPAAASLITATSRARLCAVMKALDAIYWDTDSVFVHNLDIDSANEKLKIASSWLPSFVLPLSIGEELGELDIELENAKGYLAGTKRYYLTDGNHIKRALHGMPTVPFDDAETMIEKLATGNNNEYTGRAKPMSAKEAKTGDEIGKFTKKNFLSVFELDRRLNWLKNDSGWIGTVKNNSEKF